MSIFMVNTTLLNLRSAPTVAASNIITTLPRGHIVEAASSPKQGWLNVTTKLSGKQVQGFVSAQLLAPPHPPEAPPAPTPVGGGPVLGWRPPPSTTGLRAAWFEPRSVAALASTTHRHIPVGQPGLPTRDDPDPAARAGQLAAIVTALDVEHSARYGPDDAHTYCNIYATDFCWLAQAYLPRVWWKATAIRDLSAGKAVAVDYGKTVEELNANSLYDWLTTWGDEFGWQREVDPSVVQAHANEGGVAVLCAKRKNTARSGHITAIVPEHGVQMARRQGTAVVAPLQSQAGRTNRAYFPSTWWLDLAKDFQASGFWLHA